MTDKRAKTDCYKCKWRGDLPGSAHSCCKHPETKADANDALGSMLAILASVGRGGPRMGEAAKELNVVGDPIGIKRGWFNWPWNFDPVWLDRCDGFEAKEA